MERSSWRLKDVVRGNNIGGHNGPNGGDSSSNKNPKRTLAVRDADSYQIGFGCDRPTYVQDETLPNDVNGPAGCRELEGLSETHEATCA